jgi:hypothetical protein
MFQMTLRCRHCGATRDTQDDLELHELICELYDSGNENNELICKIYDTGSKNKVCITRFTY